jgi:hypothetical protein
MNEILTLVIIVSIVVNLITVNLFESLIRKHLESIVKGDIPNSLLVVTLLGMISKYVFFISSTVLIASLLSNFL